MEFLCWLSLKLFFIFLMAVKRIADINCLIGGGPCRGVYYDQSNDISESYFSYSVGLMYHLAPFCVISVSVKLT